MDDTLTDARCDLTPISFLDAGQLAFKMALGFFAGFYNIATNNFRINQKRVDDISCRVYQRLNYYLFFHGSQLAQSRQAGLKAYWILRYRPLTLISSDAWKKSYDVNTYFAFFTVLCETLGECLKDCQKNVVRSMINKLLEEYENIFIRAFSEYDISKEAMMVIADSIKKMCLYEVKLHT